MPRLPLATSNALTGEEPDATRRLAAPSTLAITMGADRFTTRWDDVEKQFDKLVEAHLDLGDAINNCNLGEIVGYRELDKKEMEEYLGQLQVEVDELQERGHQIVESMNRRLHRQG